MEQNVQDAIVKCCFKLMTLIVGTSGNVHCQRTIFLGNQRKPNALIKYSVTEGRELERIDIKATSEVADLYYDPLTGFLWILDSELFTLNLCNTRGELVKSYSVKGIANPEALCVDHANNCIWLGDDETSNIYKITFDSL